MTTILIVEDTIELIEDLAVALELESFNVLCAENGQDAVDLALAQTPDLILTDINLPILKGTEVYTTLRNNPLTQHTPFIFMSSEPPQVDGNNYLFLQKPFLIDELLKKINKSLTYTQ